MVRPDQKIHSWSDRLVRRSAGALLHLFAGRKRFRALTALAVSGLLVAAGGVAQADVTVADGDGVVPVSNQDMAFGAIPCGVPQSKGAPVAISRNGQGPIFGTNVFRNGATVTVTVVSVTVSPLTPASLAATMGTPNTITLPGNWTALANNTMSAAVASTVTLTSTTPGAGSGTISYLATGPNTDSQLITRPDSMAVSWTTGTCVAPNTPPTVSVAGVTGGASYDKGSVPAATCLVTDAEDGNSSFAATLSAVTGPYVLDGIGSQTASCSYTDAGGLTASLSVTYSIVDPSAPVIGYTLTPLAHDGSNGWYKSAVSLAWTVTESESPNSLAKTGCDNQNIISDQLATTYSCSATSAGGPAPQQNVIIKRDATAPSVSYTSASGTPGLLGWYTSAVTATFTGTDATSGPATATDSATSTSEGAAVAVDSPAFTDNAGNTTAAGAASQSFKIDLSDPTATFDGSIGSVYFGSVPAAPTCTSTDAVSGPAGCTVSGYSAAVGTHTLTATARDVAGRTGTATQSYTVLPWTLNGFYQPVDMGGVWNTVKGGSTVPLKFEVFSGTTELTDISAVQSFTVKGVLCPLASTPTDDIELVTTGGTSLRYDSTGGQFIQNWQTPKKPGACYSTTMTTLDGSSIMALFKLK